MEDELKITIEHIDFAGVVLNKFELVPSEKDKTGRSRVFVRGKNGDILAVLKVFDDESIEFYREKETAKEELKDILECISRYDDTDSLESKGRYFELTYSHG